MQKLGEPINVFDLFEEFWRRKLLVAGMAVEFGLLALATTYLMTDWRDEEFFVILGKVEFTGRYPIRQGETLLSVIERADGIAELAFPQGSVYTCEILKQCEREHLGVLANTLACDWIREVAASCFARPPPVFSSYLNKPAIARSAA